MRTRLLFALLLLGSLPFSLKAQLSGTYTVNPAGGNFVTIQAAADALSQQGVSGPVVIRIANGTYNEQVLIDSIPGTSASSTVVFESAAQDSAAVTIINTNGSSPAKYTVLLRNVSYVTLRHLTINNAASNNFNTVRLEGNTREVHITDNVLSGNSPNLSNGKAIIETAFFLDTVVFQFKWFKGPLTIERNTIINSYAGIQLAGILLDSNSVATINENTIRSNQSLSAVYVDSVAITNNNFIGKSNGTSDYAISINNGQAFIQGNTIYRYSRAINVSNTNASAQRPFRIINNVISVIGETAISASTYALIYHNSILNRRTSSDGYIYSSGLVGFNTSLDIQNNLFCNLGKGGIVLGGNESVRYSDYNAYYTIQDTFQMNVFSLACRNLSDWQDSTGQDMHSIVANPFFDSDTTLVPANGVLKGAGSYLVAVPHDINGYPRDPNNVTVGAIEITASPNLQPITITHTPDTVVTSNGMQINYQVTNTGTGPLTASWSDGIYLCNSPSLADSVVKLSSVPITRFLPEGAGYAKQLTLGVPDTLSGGVYYVVVQVNEDLTAFDDGSDNVLASTPLIVIQSDRPDLVVTSVTVPTSIQSGQIVNITWTVRNDGTVPTNTTWYDYIYWSSDSSYFVDPQQFDPDKEILYAVAAPSGLLPGETYTQSKSYRLPLQMSGRYFAVVMADGSRQMLEGKEGTLDNIGMQGIDVSQLPLADLEVTQVSIPATAFSGDQLFFSYTVRNSGAATTAIDLRYDWIVLSRDSVVTPDTYKRPIRSRTVSHSRLMPPLDQHVVQDSIVLPSCRDGKFYLYVFTNRYDKVPELTDANNLLSDGPVEIIVKPNPDLVISNLQVDNSTLTTEAPVIIEYTIENIGFESALIGKPFTDVFFMHNSSVWDSATAERTGFHVFDKPFSLPVGEDTTIRTSFFIPAKRFGQQYISVFTDNNNRVCELPFDGNNVGTSVPVNVALAPVKDLESAQVQWPTSLVAGDVVPLQYERRNNGPGTFISWTRDSVFLVPSGQQPNRNYCLTVIEHKLGLTGNSSETITRNLRVPYLTKPGMYSLVIRTDATDAVYEHQAEANNTSVISNITVSRDVNRLPDLTPTDIATNGSAGSGQPLSITYTITNKTAQATTASSWEDEITLLYQDSSEAATFTRLRYTPLQGQSQYTVNTTITVPNGLEGDFLLRITTDSRKSVLEYNRENNVRYLPVQVTLSPWPDLTMDVFTVPDTLIYGQPNTIPYSMINQGLGVADTPWIDKLYLSTDQFLDPFDILIYSDRPTDVAIVPGATYTNTSDIVFSNAPTGFYYLLCETDATDALYEHTDEDNNLASSLGQVYVHKPMPSDLLPVADSIILQPEGYVTYTLLNKGTHPAKGRWTDVLYLSTDNTWDPTDTYIGKVTHPDTTLIAPGGLYDNFWTGYLPAVVPGWYYVIVRSDAYNLIPDTDLTNNLQASTDSFYIDPVIPLTPNVPFDTIYAKFASRSHYYSVPVNASEGMVVTMDASTPSTAVELFYRKDALPGRGGPFDARGSNAFEPSQKTMIGSDTAAYTGYALARLDFSVVDSVPYTILAEPRTFSLESVTPNHGGNEGIVVLDIRGFDLSDSMRVSLINHSDTAVAHHVFPINQLEVHAHINTNGVAAGVYDLVLERLDKGDQTILPQSYTLEDSSYYDYYLEVMAPDLMLINTPTTATVSFGNLGNINDYDVMLAIPIYRKGFFSDGFKVTYMGDGISQNLPPVARALHPFDSTTLIKFDEGYLFLAWYPILPNEGRTNFTFEIEASLADTVYVAPHIFRNPISPIHFSGDTADFKYTYFMQQLDSILSSPDPAGAGFRNGNCNTNPEQLEAIIMAGVRQQAEYTLGGLPTTGSAAAGTILTNALKNTFNPEASPEIQQVAKDLMDGWKGNATYKQSFIPGSNSYYEYLIRNLDRCLDVNEIKSEIKYKCLERLQTDDAQGRSVYRFNCPPDNGPGGGFRNKAINYVRAIDPNEIVGPEGVGAPRYIDTDEPMVYTIYFENLATAGAPARFVAIDNPLPDGLDIRQFRLDAVGWGDTIINLPSSAYFTGSVTLGSQYFNHRVDIVAGLDAVNRRAFWRFTTIDPATGTQPTNPTAGFLPPNDSTGIGEGFVRYVIYPEDSLTSGFTIANRADIQFDQEKVITTNVWVNTFKGEGLASSMLPRPAVTDSTTFQVGWDVFYTDSFAVAADRLEIYVAEGDTGVFRLWNTAPGPQSEWYTGIRGETYYFYSIAYGQDGAPEVKVLQSELAVTIDTTTGIEPPSTIQEAYFWNIFPNPFMDYLQVQLTMPEAGHVTLQAYDLYGRRVGLFYTGHLAAGKHQLAIPNAAQLPEGVLLMEWHVNDQQLTKSFIHIR